MLCAHIVRTVEEIDGHYRQNGSAPNWQGHFLTLCTCKHYMRTFRSPADWRGVCVAGFTGRTTGGPRNQLVYLMQVGQVFASQRELWSCPELPMRTKRAKVAHRQPLGDLFEPIRTDGSPFDPAGYRAPGSDHSHGRENQWYKDVDYVSRWGRRPALLVGDPQRTFLWTRPDIHVRRRLARGQMRWTVDEFLAALTMST